MEKLFETASKMKIRFNYRGVITTEDLWDLDVKALDYIYKQLMVAKKESETESLLEEKKSNPILEVQIEIVKHIFEVKVEERKAAELRAENAAKKQKILAILARKQDAELESKSAEELEKLIAEL
jgi:hypothetical protein